MATSLFVRNSDWWVDAPHSLVVAASTFSSNWQYFEWWRWVASVRFFRRTCGQWKSRGTSATFDVKHYPMVCISCIELNNGLCFKTGQNFMSTALSKPWHYDLLTETKRDRTDVQWVWTDRGCADSFRIPDPPSPRLKIQGGYSLSQDS